jgi:hypothetical protein
VTNSSEKSDEDEGQPVTLAAAEQDIASSPKLEQEIEPTLSAFFGSNKVRVSVFLNSVKKTKTTRFEQSDESNASELMTTNDVNGERLWMLLSQPSLPECLERWIWQITQDRLTAVVGAKFDPLNQTTADSLSAIREYINSAAVEPGSGPDVNNWGRIGLRWLLKKRSVDAWEVADQLGRHLFRNPSDARKIALRAMERGRSSEFKQVVAMAAVSRAIVENAQRERDTERRVALNLRGQVSRAKEDIQRLQSAVSELDIQLATKSAELVKAHSQLEAERQHSGHDLTETRAAQQTPLMRLKLIHRL